MSGAPITLVDYDPAWPERFAFEAERISGALGDRAVLVEHAGSTSVPGKPEPHRLRRRAVRPTLRA